MATLGEEQVSFEEPPALTKPEGDSEDHEEAASTVEQADSSSKATPERLCDPFLSKFAQMMNHDNVSKILEEQTHMMSVFEVANEKISSVNRISELNYHNMAVDLRQTTRALATMKRELDSIFKRIRSLKSVVASQYPEAYTQAMEQLVSQTAHSDDEDDEN